MVNTNYFALSTNQVRRAMYLYIKNRRLNDKYALAYLLGMLGHRIYYESYYTRDQLENMLFQHIEYDDVKLYTLIKSDYTRNKIVEIVKKHKL